MEPAGEALQRESDAAPRQQAARSEVRRFTRLQLMSTLSGEPLYTADGFRPVERVEDATGGAPVPLVRMEKQIDPSLLR